MKTAIIQNPATANPGHRFQVSRKTIKVLAVYGPLTLAALVMLVPFVWMISTSLTVDGYVLNPTPTLIPSPASTASYLRLFNLLNIGGMFINSIVVAVLTTAGQILTSSMAAYAFGRMSWRGRNTEIGRAHV